MSVNQRRSAAASVNQRQSASISVDQRQSAAATPVHIPHEDQARRALAASHNDIGRAADAGAQRVGSRRHNLDWLHLASWRRVAAATQANERGDGNTRHAGVLSGQPVAIDERCSAGTVVVLISEQRQSVPVNGTQWSSAVISDNQCQSTVLSGHQRSSATISGSQRYSVVISGHQRQSVAVNGTQWSSAVISGHQRQSVAVNGTQWSSAVISGHQRPSVPVNGTQWSSAVIGRTHE